MIGCMLIWYLLLLGIPAISIRYSSGVSICGIPPEWLNRSDIIIVHIFSRFPLEDDNSKISSCLLVNS